MGALRYMRNLIGQGPGFRFLLVASLGLGLGLSLALAGCASPAKTTTTTMAPAPTSSTATSSTPGATAPATTPSTQTSESAVAAYAALYSTLDAALNSAHTYLNSQPTVSPHALVFATELLQADGNRGSDLLKPGVLASVDLSLTRLKELGVQGVTVEIGYPLLLPSFPRSADYVSFFKQVAADVRSHGLKLDVETNVVFANTPFSTIKTSFAGLTLTQLANDMLAMDQTVIDNLHPDYLDVCAEPDTEASLLGLPALNDPQNFAQFAQAVAGGLKKGSTLVGAGGSTWESPAFDEALVTIAPLDFICLHVYPLSTTILDSIISSCAVGRQHGKKLVMEEAWLYKVGTGGMVVGIAANEGIFRRDVYSFWQPLDQKFLQTITQLAELEGVEYVSPFWSTYFFAYLPYDSQTASASYPQLVKMENAAVAARMKADQFSPTGRYYQGLITSEVAKGF